MVVVTVHATSGRVYWSGAVVVQSQNTCSVRCCVRDTKKEALSSDKSWCPDVCDVLSLTIPFTGFSRNLTFIYLFIFKMSGEREVRENKLSDSHTLLNSVNTFLSIFSTFFEAFLWNSVKRARYQCHWVIIYQFCKTWCTENRFFWRSTSILFLFSTFFVQFEWDVMQDISTKIYYVKTSFVKKGLEKIKLDFGAYVKFYPYFSHIFSDFR